MTSKLVEFHPNQTRVSIYTVERHLLAPFSINFRFLLIHFVSSLRLFHGRVFSICLILEVLKMIRQSRSIEKREANVDDIDLVT